MDISTITTTLEDSTYYVTTVKILNENLYDIKEYFPIFLLTFILLLLLCACTCGKKIDDIEGGNFPRCETLHHVEASFNESFVDDDDDVVVFDARTNSSRILN